MTQKKSFTFHFLILALIMWVIAAPAMAYNPTDTTATRLGSKIALFTITVPITAGSQTLYLPVRPRNLTNVPTTAFNYDIFSDTSPVSIAGSIGAVLSDTPIENDEYVLRPGQTGVFTIVVAAVARPDAPPQQLRMRVTEFPLFLGSERTPAPLNQYELSNYQTSKITLR